MRALVVILGCVFCPSIAQRAPSDNDAEVANSLATLLLPEASSPQSAFNANILAASSSATRAAAPKMVYYAMRRGLKGNEYPCRKRCALLGKKANRKARKVSFSNKRAHKVQHVNLNWKRFWWEEGDCVVRLKISGKGVRTVRKYGGIGKAAAKFGVDLSKYACSDHGKNPWAKRERVEKRKPWWAYETYENNERTFDEFGNENFGTITVEGEDQLPTSGTRIDMTTGDKNIIIKGVDMSAEEEEARLAARAEELAAALDRKERIDAGEDVEEYDDYYGDYDDYYGDEVEEDYYGDYDDESDGDYDDESYGDYDDYYDDESDAPDAAKAEAKDEDYEYDEDDYYDDYDEDDYYDEDYYDDDYYDEYEDKKGE